MGNDSPDIIVNVSLASSDRDYDELATFLERDFRIVRLGTNGDVAAAEALVREWADTAAAIAVTGIREARAAGLYDGELEAIGQVMRATDAIPVADGHALRDVLQEWAIRHVQVEMPGFFNNARTVVLGGLNHARTTRILREYTQNLEFADPLLRFDVPGKVDANPLMGLAADVGLWPIRHLPAVVKSQIKAPGQGLSHALARRAARDCDVVVATSRARPWSRRRSPTSDWPNSPGGAWTWSWTRHRSPSTSPCPPLFWKPSCWPSPRMRLAV